MIDNILKYIPFLAAFGIGSFIFSFLAWRNSVPRLKSKIAIVNMIIDNKIDETPFVSIDIVNNGSKNITITNLGGDLKSKNHFIFDTPMIVKYFVNQTLEPSKRLMCPHPIKIFEETLLREDFKNLYVIDSTNKKWFFSNKDLSVIIEKIKNIPA